jgi:dipeptidyl-peptidase-4
VRPPSRFALILLPAVVAGTFVAAAAGQGAAGPAPSLDRLQGMPGVEAHTRLLERLREAPVFTSGALNVLWAADSSSFTYTRHGERHRFDVVRRTDAVIPDDAATPVRQAVARARGPRADPCPLVPVERGRQRACEASPDRTKKAYVRDRNLYVSQADGSAERAVTTDGSDAARIKNGVASWVYGEELDQTSAIWWSPDGRKVAFYRFDERRVKDYYLQLDQTQVQSAMDVEPYPKAGTDNPIADVLVYDLATRRTSTLDVRDGRPFTDDVVGHYVYDVQWTPDSRELRLFRTDRRQQHLEYIACPPSAARCRVIVREDWPTGWVENHPVIRPLGGGRELLVASDRTGWRNYDRYDVHTGLVGPVTHLTGAEAGPIVRVDEEAGVLFYMARDGDNFMKWQLHRTGLDGRGDVRLTDPVFNHAISLSPDGRFFLDTYQTHAIPPASRVVDAAGHVVADVVKSDLSRFEQLGLRPVEQFSYPAADGRTTLYGTIAFPSTFDPAKRYPVIVSVYGGPESPTEVPAEVFSLPNTLAEYGFLVVGLGTRAAPGMGRRTLDSIYLKLGQTEVDDMAAGIRALDARPYVDGRRVGICGTSYGGYAALMAILRYPDLFDAASASSAPTDWRLYDTIYTERYMGLPQQNAAGYEAGSAMTYAANLRGRLMIYYGTADNNVHPSNALRLIQALTRAGKSFEVQVGPDLEHSRLSEGRMMEFFLENLVVRPERLLVPPAPPPSGNTPGVAD